ncbi:MAG: undecaprenyl-phosphate glucose phosphotransferase [Planctomycetota bacterium]|nr:undecaprenyl-phosphate glucose phosphotransferase [Planctomycetota bacterium]
MVRRISQSLGLAFLVLDLLFTAVAWISAYFIRFHTGWFELVQEVPSLTDCLADIPVVLLLAAISFSWTGQYRITRLRRFREELWGILQGSMLLLLLVLATIFLTRSRYEPRMALALFGLLETCLVFFARRTAWSTLRRLRQSGFDLSGCVIIGTGREGRNTLRALMKSKWLGLNVLGFVDDQTSFNSDLSILGAITDLPRLVKEKQIEQVFIALPLRRFAEVRQVFDLLSDTLVEVHLIPDLPGLSGLSIQTTSLHGMTVLGLRESPHHGINVLTKRVMDFAIASVVIVLFSPFLALIALLVKVTSKGPIFYWQDRCGLNGKVFAMYKFRSMRMDAENSSGAVWAQKEDSRKTWFGSFMRRTSLDELPQLFNVIKGDMSLVGPRPERPVFIKKFSRSIPNYMIRHSVKVGITGWAQVNGWRGNTSLRKRLQYDLYYITHWTPWLDLRILFLTAFRGFIHKNAY